MIKTLAMKVLEGQSIPYEAFSYPDNERDAAVVAMYLNADPADVYKTLVINRPNDKPLLVLIPASRRLNLKKLAKATGDKKLKMATHAEAEALTKLQVGGISPLALLNKGFVIYCDESLKKREQVFLSAGQKGINLKVAAKPLQKLLKARLADVADDMADSASEDDEKLV